MNRCFADTFYWVALTSPREWRHTEATAVSARLGAVGEVVTTEEVLIEFLTFFSGAGSYWRDRAVRVVDQMRRSSRVRIISQSSLTFQLGLELYGCRLDKGYSLTDCISMQTMRREGLTDILTNDRHFEQEGFRAVFR